MEVPNLKTEEWFSSKILYPRYFNILIWGIVIQIITIISCVTLFNCLTLSIGLVFSSLGDIFRMANFLSLSSLVLATICLIIVHLHNYKTAPTICSSLWTLALEWTNFKRMFYTISLVAIYISYGNWLSSLCGFNEPFLTKSQNDSSCLSEKPVALTVYYSYLGIITSISYFHYHQYSLKFESVVQLKVYTVKMKMKDGLKDWAKKTVSHLIRFLFLYISIGSIVKVLLPSINGMPFCNKYFWSFSTINELLAIKFLLVALVTSYSIFVTHNSILILSQVFLTERCQFSLDSFKVADQVCQLTSALKNDKHPLLQHLAFLDLKHLAEFSEKRRSLIFSVSYPGGHPHTWNSICNETLLVINSFTASLQDILAGKPSSICQSPTTQKIEKKNSPIMETIQRKSPARLRNIADNCNLPKPLINYSENTMKMSPPNTMALMASKLKTSSMIIVPKSLFDFFIAESMDKNFENAFYNSQLVIWSIQSLTLLTVASYNEDKYGVVQWKILKILASFLDLNSVLEKVIRPKRNEVSCKVWQFQQSLKAAVNNSLFRIMSIFHSNLNYLELSEEQKQRLQCHKI